MPVQCAGTIVTESWHATTYTTVWPLPYRPDFPLVDFVATSRMDGIRHRVDCARPTLDSTTLRPKAVIIDFNMNV